MKVAVDANPIKQVNIMNQKARFLSMDFPVSYLGISSNYNVGVDDLGTAFDTIRRLVKQKDQKKKADLWSPEYQVMEYGSALRRPHPSTDHYSRRASAVLPSL